MFYFSHSSLSPGDQLYRVDSTSFVNLNYFPGERTDNPSTLLRDQREHETKYVLRLRINGTPQDRIRPVVDNGVKIVDLRKITHQQKPVSRAEWGQQWLGDEAQLGAGKTEVRAQDGTG